MTEVGVVLSNPLIGERRPSFVGLPLPGVEIKLIDDTFNEISPDVNGDILDPGEIIIRSKNVFKEYWNLPEVTKKEFIKINNFLWFKTGDLAII